jgi:DNA-directed RNA polymerase subunit RPC12/RpoP
MSSNTYKMVYECKNCQTEVTIDIAFEKEAPTGYPFSVAKIDGSDLQCDYCGGNKFSILGKPRD